MKVFVKTYGWPYIPVRRDDFGVIEEDKWFGVRGLSQKSFNFHKFNNSRLFSS